MKINTIAVIVLLSICATSVSAREYGGHYQVDTQRNSGGEWERNYREHSHVDTRRDFGKKNNNSEKIAIGVGALILGAVIAGAYSHRDDPEIQTQPYYNDNEQEAYQRGLRARLERERIEREQRAYQCGYYGNC